MIKGIIVGVITALFLVSVAVEFVVPFTSFWDFWGAIAEAMIPATATFAAAARPRRDRTGILRRADAARYERKIRARLGGTDE
jgi:hypothetical protein